MRKNSRIRTITCVAACAALALSAPNAFSQAIGGQGVTGYQGPGSSASQAPTTQRAVVPPTSSGAPGPTLLEARRQTLLYGIDSQILDLLSSLTSEKTTALDPEIATVFKQSTNTDVRAASISYLRLVADWSVATDARQFVVDYASSGKTNAEDLLIGIIRYLSDAKDASSLGPISRLMGDQSKAVAGAAIDAVGKSADKSYATKILADLNDPGFPSDLKPELLLALGNLKPAEAVPDLTKILTNPDQDSVMRGYACYALGQIGDPSSLDAIVKSFSDKDTQLRAYAVTAMAHYSGNQVDALLSQALRDDFWRVRVAAAQTLADKKAAAAVPILEYKARYDPEPNVELAAVVALGKIATPDALSFLRDIYSADRVAYPLRTAALDGLAASDLSGSLSAITAVMDLLWSADPTSRLLDYTCKTLSESKGNELKPVFLRFLDGPTLNIKIYGIRGIALNRFADLLDTLKQLTTDKNNPFIRQEALNAVNALK